MDVLLTLTTPMTQIAASLTREMDRSPILLFGVVSDPYVLQIAHSPCIKPKHIRGLQALPPYDSIVPLILLQDPNIETIATSYNPDEVNGLASAIAIAETAEALGLGVESFTVASNVDAAIAAEELAKKGVQAFVLPTDFTVVDALPDIMAVAEAYNLPILHVDASLVYSGVTIGAGLNYYHEGANVGRILIAHLNDQIDIATTAITRQPTMTIALNLDSAEAQGIEISSELLSQADFVLENGESSEAVAQLPAMTAEDRQAADTEFLESLHCTPEMIAEQQAALGAASE